MFAFIRSKVSKKKIIIMRLVLSLFGEWALASSTARRQLRAWAASPEAFLLVSPRGTCRTDPPWSTDKGKTCCSLGAGWSWMCVSGGYRISFEDVIQVVCCNNVDLRIVFVRNHVRCGSVSRNKAYVTKQVLCVRCYCFLLFLGETRGESS